MKEHRAQGKDRIASHGAANLSPEREFSPNPNSDPSAKPILQSNRAERERVVQSIWSLAHLREAFVFAEAAGADNSRSGSGGGGGERDVAETSASVQCDDDVSRRRRGQQARAVGVHEVDVTKPRGGGARTRLRRGGREAMHTRVCELN
eukprot:2710580-Pleurochrysis_carterae.AAC.1